MAEWDAYRDRIVAIARMGAEEYGLIPELHPHAGGFMDFEPEIERILQEVDAEHAQTLHRHRPLHLCGL